MGARYVWPSVLGGSSLVPDQNSGRTKQGVEDAKNSQVRTGYPRLRLCIATLHTRTISSLKKLPELEEERFRIKWDILGRSEHKEKGHKGLIIHSGYIGQVKDEGVGLLIHKKHIM